MLSNRVCRECHNKLATFYYFKQEMVSKQEKLYQLLEAAKFTSEYEVEQFQDDQQFDDSKPAKFEPEVNIKTETGFDCFKISEVFDYDDVHSVTQMNFDQYEVPETSDFLPIYKKRKRKDPFRDANDGFERKIHKKASEPKK